MQRLEVSGAVRPIYGSLGVKRLTRFQRVSFYCRGQNSVRGIEDHHGLDGSEFKPGKGKRFSHQGSFPGARQWRRSVDHPPPSSADVNERVELYPYSPFWAFVVCVIE